MSGRSFGLFSALGRMCCAALVIYAPAALAQEPLPTLRVVRPAPNLPAATSQPEIAPPDSVAAKAPAEAVTLGTGSTSAVLQRFEVKRRIPIASLRSQPKLRLGSATVDVTPVLQNPAAPINLAGRLKVQTGLVTDVIEHSEAVEIEQGLILRQFVSYRNQPGTCSTAGRRAQLERSGVHCFRRTSAAERNAAYADPANPRYVASSARRAEAIAQANDEAGKERADLAAGIADFRAMMKNPARRAEAESELGAGEAARLSALSDEQLEAELVNTAEIQIEETMFVPLADKLDLVSAGLSLSRVPRPVPQVPERVDVEKALPEHVYLTGFTVGRQNEWRRRVSITVKTCVVGCKRTYYVEVYAGFGYGFGLRFPIRMGGLYSYHRVGDQESASIAPVFQPIDGNEADYSASGLSSEQIFRGQELVAELDAYAGMNYKVPFHSDGVSTSIGSNLTESLPAPYTNGQFAPPAPGDPVLAREIVLDDPDLLGGLANYGVAGAKVLPAVRVGLTSDRLRLKLTDNISGAETDMVTSGQTYPLEIDPADHSSSFSIGYPDYSLGFEVTPGLAARLFVDVGIWSDNWDWPVWFPQVSVTLPPSGLSFTCHKDTVCSRAYRYSPSVEEEEIESVMEYDTQMDQEIYNWRRRFRNQWFRQCPSLPLMWCEYSIASLAQTTGNVMHNQMSALPVYPSTDSARIMFQRAEEADAKAELIILDSQVAAIGQYGKQLFATYEAIWSEGCGDQLCRDRIHAMATPYVNALEARQKASPGTERNQVVFLENTQGGWAAKARQEVEASRNRVTRLRPAIRIDRR